MKCVINKNQDLGSSVGHSVIGYVWKATSNQHGHYDLMLCLERYMYELLFPVE